jgi:hypothetical protein
MSKNPLLSAQQNPHAAADLYTVYDPEEILMDITPSRWYPAAQTRIYGMYIVYLIAIIGNLTGIIWQAVRYKNTPIFIDIYPISWGWHFVYFSYWVLCLQVFFFLFASFDLFMRYRPSSPSIHAIKERLYDTIFSLTVLDFIVFWAFVFTERVKNIGEGTMTYQVWILDFICNFLPMVFIIIETVIVHHRFAETLCRIIYEVLLPLIIFGGYVGFSFAAHHHNDHWPYPIQNKATNQGIILFYVCGGLVLILGYIIAKTISKFLWSDQPKHNPENVLHYAGSFTTESVFSSFANEHHNQNTNQHYIPPPRQQSNAGVAESLVVGSPQQNSFNGYGTVDPYNGKGYY